MQPCRRPESIDIPSFVFNVICCCTSAPLAHHLAASFPAGTRLNICVASKAESATSARSLRRQRNLDQIEIPEDHVLISKDILGKGGFGTVYIADYNGRKAAAKVRVPKRDTMGMNSTLTFLVKNEWDT